METSSNEVQGQMTAQVGKLTAQIRKGVGKSIANKLRADGRIPAVVYGKKAANLMLTVDPVALKKSLDPGKRHNTVIDLTIEDEGKSEVVTVMLKDYQIDTIKQTVLHADFIRVSLDEEIDVSVPLVLEGRPEGVKFGGNLHQVFRDLPVSCKPHQIPSSISTDVSAMQLNDSIQVKDLPLAEGVKVNLPLNQTVALVMAPKKVAEEELGADVEGAAEGEVAAEGEAKKEEAPAKKDKKD